MDFIISFFRDTLDGTTYVIVCSISAVLLCACIGYLADKKTKKSNDQQVTNNEASSPLPQTPQPVPEPLENIATPQPENINVSVNNGVPTPEQTYQNPEPTPVVATQESPTIAQQVNSQEQPPIPAPVEQAPVENQPATEQPIFPPIDNGQPSPVGINASPIEATAPTPQVGEQIPQEQNIFPPVNQQTPQTPQPVMGENINTVATPENIPNVNPNLAIPQEGIGSQQIGQQPFQQTVPTTPPLPNETSPSMEAANLDMPQMPIENQQPVQAETLDNITEATEQIEEDQIIDNPSPTAVTTEPPMPAQQVAGMGQVNQTIPTPNQTVPPIENQNI